MQSHLVAVDVDGTLLDDSHRVSSRTRRALSCVAQKGHVLALASSRSPAGLQPVLDQLDRPTVSWLVCSQGALVIDTANQQRLMDVPMSATTARRVLDIAHQANVPLCWYVGERMYVTEMGSTVRAETLITGESPHLTPDPLLDGGLPHKILCLPQNDRGGNRDLEWLMKRAGASATTSKPGYIELTSHAAGKHTGVRAVADQLTIPSDRIVAFGDADNDVQLLETVGRSVAMGNATEAVRRVATHLTADNNHDGVAQFLETMFALDP